MVRTPVRTGTNKCAYEGTNTCSSDIEYIKRKDIEYVKATPPTSWLGTTHVDTKWKRAYTAGAGGVTQRPKQSKLTTC